MSMATESHCARESGAYEYVDVLTENTSLKFSREFGEQLRIFLIERGLRGLQTAEKGKNPFPSELHAVEWANADAARHLFVEI